MADQRVKQIATPVSEAEITRALIDATKELYGISLTKPQVAILISQNNLETNHRKSMHNYNIGNITHVTGDGWDYFAGGDKSKDKAGHWKPVTLKFRSFPDLAAGAKDYIKNIHNRGGGGAWKTIMNADIHAFSKELKRTGYYEADEKAYTNALLSGVNSYNKQNSYEKAHSGQFEKAQPIATNVAHDGSAMASTYSSESLVPSSNTSAAIPEKFDFLNKINGFLDQFINSIASSQVSGGLVKKTAYKKLPQNKILIKIESNDLVNSLEFARILCLALDEEAQAETSVHTNRNNVEVFCNINGPEEICNKAVSQLSKALGIVFKEATKKIGGIEVKTNIILNELPSYQELDIKLALSTYRQFHLKFIK